RRHVRPWDGRLPRPLLPGPPHGRPRPAPPGSAGRRVRGARAAGARRHHPVLGTGRRPAAHPSRSRRRLPPPAGRGGRRIRCGERRHRLRLLRLGAAERGRRRARDRRGRRRGAGARTVRDTLVVVNPASAGGRTAKQWPLLQRCLVDAGVDFEARITSAPADAIRLTREALREGFQRIVGVGGDGTLNEIVNGWFDPDTREPINPDACLGLLPSGTGGDFRKTAGIPLHHAAACALLARGDVRRIDCGIGGDVVHRVNRSRKAAGGTVTFLWHSLAALMTYGSRLVRVYVDGRVTEGPMQNVVIANGRCFGGGMRIAPDASIDDGLFDVVTVAELTRRRSLTGLSGLYRGRHIGRPGIGFTRGRVVTVVPLEQRPVLFDVEGEQVGRAPATLTCLPGALRFCAPAHA